MDKPIASYLWPGLLLTLLLVGFCSPLHAQTDYRVTGVTFSQTVTAAQFVRVTDDLTVSWTAPTVTQAPMNYYLKFSESNAPWTGLNPDNAATYDFVVQHPKDFQIIDKSFFAAYDSDKVRYLHIITQYLNPQTSSLAYSTSVVSAAIRIDNVAPTGTLTLDPTSGSTRQINVTMSPSEPIKFYWLNDQNVFPGDAAATDYTLFPSGTIELRAGTQVGNVTIYGWFADFAGNRTTPPSATAIYDYKAPVTIQHSASQIAAEATLGFTVDGSTTYNWTLTDMADGVAEFVGASTGVHSVTVRGKKAGTFTVTATPTVGPGTLKTGTITVVQTFTRGDVNNDGVVDSGDAILVLRYSVKLTTLTDSQKAAGNVTGKTSNDDIDSGDAIRILRYSVKLIDVL